jgi:hypothetical protein
MKGDGFEPRLDTFAKFSPSSTEEEERGKAQDWNRGRAEGDTDHGANARVKSFARAGDRIIGIPTRRSWPPGALSRCCLSPFL